MILNAIWCPFWRSSCVRGGANIEMDPSSPSFVFSFSLLSFVVDLVVGCVFDCIAFIFPIVLCLDFGRCFRIHAGSVNCDRCGQDK